jgi:uncharacterized protein
MSSADAYDSRQRQALLDTARRALEHGVASGRMLVPELTGLDPALCEPRGVFVTLHDADGALRGCIGSLQPRGPLVQEVTRAAFNAGFEDPRFPPLAADELAGLQVHISVLGPSEEIHFESERDLLQQLRPGMDGLILEDGHRMGTFLPDVWTSLPTPDSFLRQLRVKAGLPPDHWSSTVRVRRYTTEAFP